MEFKSLFAALICTLPFFFSSCEKDEEFENVVEKRVQDTKVIDVESDIKISEDMFDLYDVTITYDYNGKVATEQVNKKDLVGTQSENGKNHSVYLLQKYSVNKTVNADEINITISARPKGNIQEILDQMPDNKVISLYCKADCLFNVEYSDHMEEFSFVKSGLHKEDMNKILKTQKIVMYNANLR